jgi:DUF971 family protein
MPRAETPASTEIRLHQKSRVLEIAFAGGRGCRLPFELLRVYSPSAEVRGHRPGQQVLQTGKRGVDNRHLHLGLCLRAGREARPASGAGPQPT